MDYFGPFSSIFGHFWPFLAWKRGQYHLNGQFSGKENVLFISIMKRCHLVPFDTKIVDFQKRPHDGMSIFCVLHCKPL